MTPPPHGHDPAQPGNLEALTWGAECGRQRLLRSLQPLSLRPFGDHGARAKGRAGQG